MIFNFSNISIPLHYFYILKVCNWKKGTVSAGWQVSLERIKPKKATDVVKKQKCEEKVKRQKSFRRTTGVLDTPYGDAIEAVGAIFSSSTGFCSAVLQNNGRAPEIKEHKKVEICIYPSKFMETERNVYTLFVELISYFYF